MKSNLNQIIKLLDKACLKHKVPSISECLLETQSELMEFWIMNKCAQFICWGCKDPENPCTYASAEGCTHPDHPVKKRL